MDEQKKYEVIKALADHPNGSKDRAALTLGCTKRHINRMLAGYRKEGKAFFVHGNRGRKPATTIFLKKPAILLSIFTALNITMLTFNILRNSWLNSRVFMSPLLLLEKFWNRITFFPRKSQKPKRNESGKNSSLKKNRPPLKKMLIVSKQI